MARSSGHKRKRADNERRRYHAKRVAALRARFPELAPEMLTRATLRQVSTCVRRAGVCQGTLGAFKETEISSGPLSKESNDPRGKHGATATGTS